ncbi:MAG TPA: transcription elongation factor GreA [Saprospiraceae bacterium]|nr:transcription elongation factor GreA [Saprospiraceae bacterium]
MSKVNYMSKEGYEKIKEELRQLKTVERKKAADAIAEAREKGDLSENAEYDAAKDAQGMLEMKINEMEQVMASARVIDEKSIDTSKVSVFTKVKIKNKKLNKTMTYQLVSASEANLKEKKISVTSPIGEGLLGKSVGESAVIHTPGGKVEFEVMEIFL